MLIWAPHVPACARPRGSTRSIFTALLPSGLHMRRNLPLKTSFSAAPETEACEIFSQRCRPRGEQIMAFDPKCSAERHSGLQLSWKSRLAGLFWAGQWEWNPIKSDGAFPKSLYLHIFKVSRFLFLIIVIHTQTATQPGRFVVMFEVTSCWFDYWTHQRCPLVCFHLIRGFLSSLLQNIAVRSPSLQCTGFFPDVCYTRQQPLYI